jgi:hypothetical protein
MTFDIPVSKDILGLVVLGAGHLNLLETPLRQIDISCSQIAVELGVPKPECCRQCAELGVVTRRGIIDNLDLPVVLLVTNCDVTVTRDFVVTLGNRSSDLMRVQVASSLCVEHANNSLVTHKSNGVFWVEFRFVAVGIEEPVVIGVLVMVASDLLLHRSLWVCLNVRMKQSTTIAHVFQRRPGTICNLERAVLSNFRPLEIRLEQRAHLSITRTRVLQDEEV